MSGLRRVAGRPTWLLSRANARAQGLLTDAFADEGVRGYHFRLLAALEQYGPASQAELGRHTGIDRSDVVATLNDEGIIPNLANKGVGFTPKDEYIEPYVTLVDDAVEEIIKLPPPAVSASRRGR